MSVPCIEPVVPTSSGAAWIAGAWTAAGTALYLLWPALAPTLLPLCLLMPLIWYWREYRRLVVFPVSRVSIALLLVSCYAFINAQWSMAPQEALSYAVMLVLGMLCLHVGLGAWERINDRRIIAAMGLGFYLGFVLAGCVLCFEILTHHSMLFRLMGSFPDLWPQSQKYLADGALPPHFLNHRMAAIAILFWPAVLASMQIAAGPSGRNPRWLLGLMPALVAVGFSEHATSQLALVMGLFVVLVAIWSSRLARRGLILAWMVACLGVIPLSLGAYEVGAHHFSWLPPSAQDRLVIWKATSDRIAEAYILGVGIHSGRAITRAEPETPLAPGTPYKLSVGWHSHNAFLQVWFETGLVGIILLLLVGLLVLRSIASSDRDAQPALMAAFAGCTMVAATGFSAFAPWLVASYAIAVLFAALTLAHLRARRDR